MSEWKEYKLGEIAEIKGGKRLPKGELLVDYETPHPYIRVTDMGKKWIRKSGLQFVTPKVQKTISRYVVNSGDVILSIVGSIGLVGRISQELNGANLTENCVKLLTNKTIVNDDFLFYFLISDEGQYEIEKRNVGSTQPKLPLYNIKDIDIFLPPLPEQKAIASILSCLDDKIDLLHRQNATLEKMAETLFRQWFIEEAKEEWESRPLSSIANFLNGLACQKFPPKNDVEMLPVLKIKELNSGISENSDWATTEVNPEYIVKNGDVIFAWSASLMVKIWDGQDCILNQHLFKVTSEYYPKWFYYLWCKYHLDEFIVKAASHATTMGHIKRSDLDEAMVLIPSDKELEEMTLEVEPLINKIISNNKQIKLLINLRDILLPKLMSGEITVNQG